MTDSPRVARLRARLEAGLAPSVCEIVDESHLHAGHAGAATGRGHFRVRLVSERFAGLQALARHRLVYGTLGELMESDVHALSIDARAPDEA